MNAGQYIYQMIQSEEDKRLVDQYKHTNTALRKQLMNLNDEIDKILTKKTNKVGLQKLPSVSKKITDPNVVQHEVENLRKRVELLEKDAESFKSKAAINYYQKVREVESEIQERQRETEECKRSIKQLERKDKIFNAQAAKQQGPNKWEKRIANIHDEISRYQKIEKELIKSLNSQAATENKNIQYLQELAEKHQEAVTKKQKQLCKKSPTALNTISVTNSPKNSKIGEEQWKELKKQFLIFKQSKQNEEWMLNEENQRLRAEVREWQRKIKEKKKRIQAIMENQEKNKHRQAKVYSTLQQDKVKQKRSIRYRDRNNSMQYNTKN